jgi:hypothetical protein
VAEENDGALRVTWDDDGAQPAREIKRGVRGVHVLGVLGAVAAITGGFYVVRSLRAPVASPGGPPIVLSAPVEQKVPAYATMVREAGPVDPEPPPRLDRLHVRASTKVSQVIVGTRSVSMTLPATHVSVALEAAEINAPFKIEVVAADGRRWSKLGVVSKGVPIEVPFGGLPPGLTSACSDGQRSRMGTLLDFQDGAQVRTPIVRAAVDRKGKFSVWRSSGRTAGTFAGTYSGEGLHRLQEAMATQLPSVFPAKHARASTLRKVLVNRQLARFADEADLPAPWRAVIDATSSLVEVAPEVPWAAVGIEVARDGKSWRVVHRGCQPVHVDLIEAELRVTLESTTTGQTRKSWSATSDDFHQAEPLFDLGPGASHVLPFAPGFEPAAGERVVVHLKAKMRDSFEEGIRDPVSIDIEGASSL